MSKQQHVAIGEDLIELFYNDVIETRRIQNVLV
jgi:hypothetical protein